MRLCRFDDDRLGLVNGDAVRDVTVVLNALPRYRWPLPIGDDLIRNLDRLRPAIEQAAVDAAPRPLASVTLRSPVANPSKIIGAPVNYVKHRDEAQADSELHQGNVIRSIRHHGLFLKSVSSLKGVGETIALRFPDRRTDHEVELAVVIARLADRVSSDAALSYVAGYSIGLDLTLRGPEDRSLRKSIDGYTVLGPTLVTADEIRDPGSLEIKLSVNGELRQHSSTRHLIYDVPRLIAFASSFYVLYPGDVILTGTPEGVGTIAAGDRVEAEVESIGTFALVPGMA
jgi:2,4-didehydro-3-deoxy-L-rhamnonate hydrolase